MLCKGQGACLFCSLMSSYYLELCLALIECFSALLSLLDNEKTAAQSLRAQPVAEAGSEPRWFCLQSPFSSAFNILPWLPCPSPLHHPLSPINSGNVFPVPWITKTGLIVLVVLFLSLVITFLYLVAIAYLSMFFSNQSKFLEGRDWVLFITEF